MSNYLFDVSLVSAYDLSYGTLMESNIYATDVVILDSGGYEALAGTDDCEPYGDLRPGRDWLPDAYERVLADITPSSKLVIVSFDSVTPTPFKSQLNSASILFKRYPEFAGDFLCKPESLSEPLIDTASLLNHLDDIAAFDLIGVTEKELEESVLKRCERILQIRSALAHRGYETPIHVFGCLDPVTILAYFLCGADVFDGLAWLRFAFSHGIPTYHATSTILGGNWADRDIDVVAAQRVQNLTWLRMQAKAMHRYCGTYSPNEFEACPELWQHAARLAEAAGLTF
jgi:hypothetical protein